MKISKRFLRKRCFALCSAIQIFHHRGEDKPKYSILNDLRIKGKIKELSAHPMIKAI